MRVVSDSSPYRGQELVQRDVAPTHNRRDFAAAVRRSAFEKAGNGNTGQGPTAAAQAVRNQMTGDRISLEGYVTGLRGEIAKDAAAMSTEGDNARTAFEKIMLAIETGQSRGLRTLSLFPDLAKAEHAMKSVHAAFLG